MKFTAVTAATIAVTLAIASTGSDAATPNVRGPAPDIPLPMVARKGSTAVAGDHTAEVGGRSGEATDHGELAAGAGMVVATGN